MQKVSIILPTYNERENIVELIREIQKNLHHSVEIIVVDDDSPDKTWQVVESIKDENVKLLRRVGQRCLTTAISDGIAISRGDIIGWMDCDFSMPPERLPVLVESLKDHDIAIGSRYVGDAKDKRDTFLGIISSKIINHIAKYILNSSITDYTSGFVVAKKKVLMEIPLKGDYGEYCIDFLYKATKKGFKVKEVPYECIPRRSGETKTAPDLKTFIKRGMKYISTILRLRLQDL